MKKKIAIVLLGGTIACTVNEKNECIVVSLKDFCSRFRELDSYDIIVDDFRQLSGAETRFSDMIDVANEVKRLIGEEQANGVVVVQGTNLMEEMAFGLDILLRTDVPVVCTGAMRPATSVSADGPYNLIDAVAVAACDLCRGMGVLVVMNEKIHSAQYVRKEHGLCLDAFQSEFMLGYVAEHVPSLRGRPV